MLIFIFPWGGESLLSTAGSGIAQENEQWLRSTVQVGWGLEGNCSCREGSAELDGAALRAGVNDEPPLITAVDIARR